MKTSSKCHVSPGPGLRRRNFLANSAPNFPHQRRMLSWGNHHAPFGEDELDIPQAEAEEVIQPYCVADDLARKSMAAIEGRLSAHSGSFPWPTSTCQSRLT